MVPPGGHPMPMPPVKDSRPGRGQGDGSGSHWEDRSQWVAPGDAPGTLHGSPAEGRTQSPIYEEVSEASPPGKNCIKYTVGYRDTEVLLKENSVIFYRNSGSKGGRKAS